MQINIISVGNIKEKYFTEAINEYSKRIGAFCKINIVEVKEADYKSCSKGEIAAAKQKEAEAILNKCKGYVVAMDGGGKELSSPKIAEQINKIFLTNSTINFVIGGSYGLDESIINKADFVMSLGKITFPHQLFRVVLLEQIYRAFTILNNKTYHK